MPSMPATSRGFNISSLDIRSLESANVLSQIESLCQYGYIRISDSQHCCEFWRSRQPEVQDPAPLDCPRRRVPPYFHLFPPRHSKSTLGPTRSQNCASAEMYGLQQSYCWQATARRHNLSRPQQL